MDHRLIVDIKSELGKLAHHSLPIIRRRLINRGVPRLARISVPGIDIGGVNFDKFCYMPKTGFRLIFLS